MSAWVLVPCLVALREEFNAVNPNRDKGADGSIGDNSHTSSSDHTPDEDSDVLRDHDADNKNEVHALDIDSSGPWPEDGWFNRAILDLVERERVEYESPTTVGRLKYVIWNRRIAKRSNGWRWEAYTLSDPHTNHAHFSSRYESGPEADDRSWGIEDSVMPTVQEIAAEVVRQMNAAEYGPAGRRETFAQRIADTDANAESAAAGVAALTSKVDALTAKVDALAAGKK